MDRIRSGNGSKHSVTVDTNLDNLESHIAPLWHMNTVGWSAIFLWFPMLAEYGTLCVTCSGQVLTVKPDHDHLTQNHCLSPHHHYLFVSFYLNTIVYTWVNDQSGRSIAVNSNTIACLFQSQGSTFGQSRVEASLVGQFISVKFLVKPLQECSHV